MVQILFIISVICLLALIGASAAIIRHVRASHRNRPQAPPEPTFAEHLQAAAEQDPMRSPRPIPHQTVQSITAKKDWGSSTPLSTPPDKSVTSERRISPFIVHRSSERADQISLQAHPHSLRVAAGTRTASSKRF